MAAQGRKRKSLADELAELVNPAPRAETDPDAFNDGNAMLHESDDELLDMQPGSMAARQAKEAKRLRGELVLEDVAYQGRRTTRAAVFGREDGETEHEEADSADEDGEAQTSAGENGNEELANGFNGSSNDDVSEGGGGGEEKEEEDANEDRDAVAERRASSAAAGRPNGHATAAFSKLANGKAAGAERTLQRQADADSDSSNGGWRAQEGADLSSGAAAALSLRDDPELKRLEKEYEGLQEEDAAAAAALRQRSTREASKGAAVARQLLLYDRALENRILVQQCLAASHVLPRPEGYQVAVLQQPQVAERFASLRAAITGALQELLQLRAVLMAQNPAIGAEGASSMAAAGAQTSEELWALIEAQHLALAAYRDSSLDRWHRRTVLSSGSGALRNGLRALNQSVTSQVAAVMRDPTRFVQRTRLPLATRPRPLCEPVDTAPSVAGAAAAVAAAVAPAPSRTVATDADGPLEDNDEDRRDGETFDDSEFYQQLLKEFLDKGSAGAAAAATSTSNRVHKKRKLVDRRASKGRKIRYTVQDKLVNFMAPVTSELPPFAAQLFANLFGHAGKRGQTLV